MLSNFMVDDLTAEQTVEINLDFVEFVIHDDQESCAQQTRL